MATAGSGFLEFERIGERTVVRRAEARSPLRLLTPKNRGQAAWVYAGSYGGGLVGGDALDVSVRVGARAEAVLLTQAMTKVYRSPLGARQSLTAEVGAGALLAVVPDPVMCFAGSSFAQSQEFRLGAEASLVFVDAMICGRHGAGERWLFDRFQSRARIWREGLPVLNESLLLDPRAGALAERQGRYNTFCTLIMTGPQAREAAAEVLAGARPRREGVAAAASAFGSDGVVARLAGESSEPVSALLRSWLAFLPPRLGDDPWERKW